MISDPNRIYYACIAKGSVILGEFLSKEPGISESLRQECIDKTPPYHSMFSHTVCNKTYTFLMNDPFTYFAIADETVGKSESLGFLNHVKSAFEEILERGSILSLDDVSPHYCQAQFDVIICEIMGLDLNFLNSSRSGSKDGRRNSSVDSSKGRGLVLAPLLGKPNKGLKKKKRTSGEREVVSRDIKDAKVEKKVDVSDDVTMQKNALYTGDRQKANQIWKKHVWIVLGLDLFVCAVLFGIWLWVCRGFHCIDG